MSHMTSGQSLDSVGGHADDHEQTRTTIIIAVTMLDTTHDSVLRRIGKHYLNKTANPRTDPRFVETKPAGT
jgi:hypothetical protein